MSVLPWATIGRLLAAVAGVWVFARTWQLWMLLLTALILAAAILPAARWGDRHRVPRLATVAGVYLGAALVVAVLGRFLVPAFVEQGTQFAAQLPALIENAKGWAAQLVAWGARWEIPLPAVPAGGEGLTGLGKILLENTLRATAGVIGAVVGFFLIVVLAAYLVIDAEHLGRALAALLPAAHRERAAALAPPVLAVMGGYVRGQFVVSLCVGGVIAAGLALLGVPYSLLIGGIAATLNVIPFLGSPAAAVLGILSAFNISGSLALWTALLFWGANLLEAKLLVPYFVGRATGLHPVAVLLGILGGAQLAGLVGALVAIPLLAGAWEVVRQCWVDSPGRGAGLAAQPK
ncbi:MAG: AI-2E family transporter [Candidatus Rokubacteria bacterium]|nr:AI-2E family transporter [Candidatus Rokubacteria bacterium]